MLAFAIGLALTVPDIPVVPMLAVLIPLMIIVPTFAYPFSKTIWVAVDRALLQHLDTNERLDEQHATTSATADRSCVKVAATARSLRRMLRRSVSR